MRALIVDDEPLARENLRIRLRRYDDIHVVGEAMSAPDALAKVRETAPDLVFLDVEMPGQDGFSLLEDLDPDETPVVVFVTAYEEYALRAFGVHALDYLLKPVDEERLAEALARARERVLETRRATEGRGRDGTEGDPARSEPVGSLTSHGDPVRGHPLERLVVKMSGRVFFVRTSDIEWIQADGDYVRIHVGSRNHLIRKTMRELERGLDPRVFVRVHRSAIVNVDRIRELRPAARGEYTVVLGSGAEVKLTRTFRSRLEAFLEEGL